MHCHHCRAPTLHFKFYAKLIHHQAAFWSCRCVSVYVLAGIRSINGHIAVTFHCYKLWWGWATQITWIRIKHVRHFMRYQTWTLMVSSANLCESISLFVAYFVCAIFPPRSGTHIAGESLCLHIVLFEAFVFFTTEFTRAWMGVGAQSSGRNKIKFGAKKRHACV